MRVYVRVCDAGLLLRTLAQRSQANQVTTFAHFANFSSLRLAFPERMQIALPVSSRFGAIVNVHTFCLAIDYLYRTNYGTHILLPLWDTCAYLGYLLTRALCCVLRPTNPCRIKPSSLDSRFASVADLRAIWSQNAWRSANQDAQDEEVKDRKANTTPSPGATYTHAVCRIYIVSEVAMSLCEGNFFLQLPRRASSSFSYRL